MAEQAAHADDDPAAAGLCDGFDEYATPTEDEYSKVLRKGLVVVDTNVLLNLYRYHPATRDDLFQILEALGDRLFVPHQVAAEFWRNRETVIRSAAEETTQLSNALQAQQGRSLLAVSNWVTRIGLPSEAASDLSQGLVKAYDDLAKEVDRTSSETVGISALDTTVDPVLGRLVPVVAGRVGPPLSEDELAEAHQEAEQRILSQEPPGYADAEKSGDASHGDYILWRQILVASEARHTDVALVTGDVKDDWWRRDAGETRGPRLELSRELRRVAGVRLFMLRPASLLQRAVEALNLRIEDESVRAAETVDRLALGRQATEDRFLIEQLPDGRGGAYLDILVEMTALAEDSPAVEDYVSSFQERFPSITLREVARRRMRVLESLGLAQIRGGRVDLTESGRRLLDDRALSLAQEAFMARIAGAPEIRNLAMLTPLTELRSELRDSPPPGLSSTQAVLVLRWLEQLDLLE
jgi:predicted nucleic acid-binding protein